ncbi:PIN domain-containing protein, partial [Flavobacterium sp.]|uniref:PIN domain-containing protein n=1 Tax=Flavobacterium sp. TaxID=239 RepID=UPI0026236760
MKKVCVDTNFLVWAVKQKATVGQEYLISIAKKIVDFFEENGVTIVVPSLVLGELLSDIEAEDERSLLTNFISENFIVVQYDILCAIEFARLRVNMDKNILKEHRVQNSITQTRMKTDYNICASAIAKNCDAIITNNKKDFIKYSAGHINIYTLEDVND